MITNGAENTVTHLARRFAYRVTSSALLMYVRWRDIRTP